jgi:hypothetical protein
LANENYDKQIVAAFSINKRVIKLKIDTFVFLRGIAQEMRDTILLEYPNTDKDTLYKAIMGGINNVLAQNGSFASNDDLDEVETFIYDIIISQ